MINHLPVLIIAIPLLMAFLTPLIGFLGNNVRNTFILGTLLVVNFLIFVLLGKFIQGGGNHIFYVLGSADPSQLTPEGVGFPIRIALKVDGFSMFMALIVGIVSLSAMIYSWKFIKKDTYQNYFFVLLQLMFVGMLGISFTNDLFNFFVFLEIVSISSAALIAFRTDKKHPSYAGYKYLLVSAVSTSFLLIGIGLLYAQYGQFNITYLQNVMNHTLIDKIALVFILIPLAMKCGSFPMHLWVADTYSEAPAGVTSMLVIASQTSLYAMFRFCFDLFGKAFGEVSINYGTLGWVIVILGLLSSFVGVTMALIQHDVKRLMAYHSVSQLGYMLVALGVAVAVHTDSVAFDEYGRTAMTGGILHMLNYSFYKGLLFLTSGVMVWRFGTRNLNKMIGMAHKDTLTTIVFIIASLSIAGIPPFSGYSSKVLIYESVYRFNPLLSVVLMFVSIMTLASFMKVFYSAFLGPKRDDLLIRKESLPIGMKAGMLILTVVIIFVGLFPNLVMDNLIEPSVSSLMRIITL